MKSEQTMETTDLTEEFKDRKKQNNNELSSNAVSEEEVLESMYSEDFQEKYNPLYYRWDNLIHIDIQFYIDDLLFKEEILWERNNRSIESIKEFSAKFIQENIFSSGKRITLELIEYCSEYMTSKILQDIYFYDKLEPFRLIQSKVFDNCEIFDEHLTNISIDISDNELIYKDSFEWDIINASNIPEIFSDIIVSEMKLPHEFTYLISMSIRKQIKSYIFKLFENFTQIYTNLKEDNYEKNLNKEKDNYNSLKNLKSVPQIATIFTTIPEIIKPEIYDKSDNHINNFLPFMFDVSFDRSLGPLRKTKKYKENKIIKPKFLKNSSKHQKKAHNNGHILFYDMENIIISKKVLKYYVNYDRIIIEKNRINFNNINVD